MDCLRCSLVVFTLNNDANCCPIQPNERSNRASGTDSPRPNRKYFQNGAFRENGKIRIDIFR